MADASPSPGRWAFRPLPPEPRSVVELIRAGTLDAQLAATLWLLIEARVPIVVAAEGGTGRASPRSWGRCSTSCRPASGRWSFRCRRDLRLAAPGGRARLVRTAGRWPAHAIHPRAPEALPGSPPIQPATTVLVAAELSDHLPSYTWGAEARLAVRAVSVGYGLATTIHADSLEDVFASLERPPVLLREDELSRLGVVVLLRALADGRRRVVAAHYVRPTARDVHGHVQRLGPAVLATWDPARDAFEHFGWGITPELAERVGRRPGDFEVEEALRRDLLAALATAGVTDPDAVRLAIANHRHTDHPPTPASHAH